MIGSARPWHADAEGVVAEALGASPGRGDGGARVARDDGNESLRGGDVAVGRDGAEVVAVAHQGEAHSVGARALHRALQGQHAGERPDGAVAVDPRDRRRRVLDAGPGAGVDGAQVDAPAVRLDAHHAMGAMAEEVAHHQDACHARRVGRGESEARERPLGEPLELRLGHSALMFASRTTRAHFSVSASM